MHHAVQTSMCHVSPAKGGTLIASGFLYIIFIPVYEPLKVFLNHGLQRQNAFKGALSTQFQLCYSM